jgi:YegS/Rv2252/BmrU family lipid kinase
MARICTLIINPVSGGYSEQKLRQVAAALQAGGLSPELLLTENADDAELFSRRICQEGEEPFLIAVGGDGTVNGVINGLAAGKATLAVLPFGTANVLAKELGIKSLADAVARVVAGATRSLTVGLLEAGGFRRRFLLMAGIGVDGFIVRGVREREKRAVGKGAYLLSAARLLLDWERERLEITAGGRRIECHSVIVCNAARYGGGFILTPGAELFTPEFQVACITADTRRAYLRLALAVISGRVMENRDVVRFGATELLVSGKKAVQADGDYFCDAPVRITAEAGFARLII